MLHKHQAPFCCILDGIDIAQMSPQFFKFIISSPSRLENRQPSMGSPALPATDTPGSPTSTIRTGLKNRNKYLKNVILVY